MIKSRELADPLSCLNRAADDEMCFVLLGRDAAAPVAIRAWIDERIRLGKNTADDTQIMEAAYCIERMQGVPAIVYGEFGSRKAGVVRPTPTLPTLAQAERRLIEETLERFHGNREQSARSLQIGIRTLSGKLREYGYPPRGGPGSKTKKKTLRLIASGEHRPALVEADIS